MADKVNHPSHYNNHPSGIECIDIVEHHNFNVGNAIKYLWRAGLKVSAEIEDIATPDEIRYNEITDLKKAQWYINREIERKEKERGDR